MKKLLFGFLTIVLLWGFNVSASEEDGIIDLEVKDKNLVEVVAIVNDINVKENVQSVNYEISNDKAILYVTLEDASKYDETKSEVFTIEGVESLNETINETSTAPTTSSNCKCESISEKDLESIITANYIMYATEAILLILIVVIVVLLIKKDKKKK